MSAELAISDGPDNSMNVAFSGDWMLGTDVPGADTVIDRLRQSPRPTSIAFDTSGIGNWDTGLLATLVAIHKSAEANGVAVDDSGLPDRRIHHPRRVRLLH